MDEKVEKEMQKAVLNGKPPRVQAVEQVPSKVVESPK
jgi:hypothetical protein